MDWGPGLVEHRPRRDRDLMTARRALPEQPFRQRRRVVRFTGGTVESVRPSGSEKVGAAGSLVRKTPLELEDRPREVRPPHAEVVAELTG